RWSSRRIGRQDAGPRRPSIGGVNEIRIPARWVAGGTGVPAVCSRHGAPSAVSYRARYVSRPPTWSYGLFVIPVVFAVAVTLVRKSVVAPAWPFCARCKAMRARLLMTGLGLLVLSGAGFAGAVAFRNAGVFASAVPLLVVGGFVALFAGVLVAARGSTPAITRARVSADGLWIEVARPHERFVEGVATLYAVLAPPRPV